MCLIFSVSFSWNSWLFQNNKSSACKGSWRDLNLCLIWVGIKPCMLDTCTFLVEGYKLQILLKSSSMTLAQEPMTFSDLCFLSKLARRLHIHKALQTSICALLLLPNNKCRKHLVSQKHRFIFYGAKRNKTNFIFSPESLCPQANKCSIICLSQTFRRVWMSAILSSCHSEGSAPRSNQISRRQRACDVAHPWKTPGPIDGLTGKISGLTMGHQLEEADRQHSILNAEEHIWKGLATRDVRQQHPLFPESQQSYSNRKSLPKSI